LEKSLGRPQTLIGKGGAVAVARRGTQSDNLSPRKFNFFLPPQILWKIPETQGPSANTLKQNILEKNKILK
jgi:hypothetical protein